MSDRDERGRLVGWREACTILGCRKSHFYNLVNSGLLPAIRLGRRKGLRVYEADCQEYVRHLGSTAASQRTPQAHAS